MNTMIHTIINVNQKGALNTNISTLASYFVKNSIQT